MKTWDIFCRVIDNFGDIGVCWRLAKQLAAEHNCAVRLWVDELQALQVIWPSAQLVQQQTLEQVDIHQWPKMFPSNIACADVVIEAFGCDIPAEYLNAMVLKKNIQQSPNWINLEYLSAEAWVEDCHKMQSIHPATGLLKTFYFPGFTPKTGGLIREADALTSETSNPLAIEIEHKHRKNNALAVSLFAYENASIKNLFECWQKSDRPIHCIVPQGRIIKSINAFLAAPLVVDQPQTLGALTLQAIPFVNQKEYDILLQACDLNFVRGEDSLVRAIWAGKPFVWQAYAQQEDAHLTKLSCLLNLYTQDMPPQLANAVQSFWQKWNQQREIAVHWRNLSAYWTQWHSANQRWQSQLIQQKNLALTLVEFVK